MQNPMAQEGAGMAPREMSPGGGMRRHGGVQAPPGPGGRVSPGGGRLRDHLREIGPGVSGGSPGAGRGARRPHQRGTEDRPGRDEPLKGWGEPLQAWINPQGGGPRTTPGAG